MPANVLFGHPAFDASASIQWSVDGETTAGSAGLNEGGPIHSGQAVPRSVG
jgi:hypothetical protein